ncbi:alpha/beta fold hydrolase [Pelomonas sp. SE-A7]|uniref:alpha/beta hydrolase n=1 Tax=Pelomonas sp. SE-A7 TaxID=3054953 RepID=UPI00259D1270|nr:alpha/beta fold hydrolase [Pelomonas sp. SE-A7]MDM4767987.1 alpha/beta fold hydrolase [Pelomonas sp. SE-A7]
MNSQTEKRLIAGPAGAIEIAIDQPAAELRGVAVLCHPNPTQGGTLDNKVVQTLARAFVQMGYRAVRFNFRGIGKSEGQWDEGRGEVDDALAVIASERDAALPLALGGFSFGGYVASHAAQRLEQKAERLCLVGPAASRFDMTTVPADSLVIHGETDDVVPLSSVLDWARPQALPVTVVPGVGHFFHGQLPLLKHIILRGWHAPGTLVSLS